MKLKKEIMQLNSHIQYNDTNLTPACLLYHVEIVTLIEIKMSKYHWL